ncbi:hypothetical protein RND81_12G055600 [Saponaria officinalis]|uniref:RRM domain-containing protein n=1 Tax=Saponaria officinalis TaxID=3572 RepID=A0AAW1H7A6_SAPOF
MGRHRSRSRSYSPRRRSRSRTPPHIRRKHYDEPHHRRRSDRRSPPPSGLLVRNIPLDTRPEELRIPFEKFGPVKDVYLPRDYYSGEPRGFGFVKFRFPEDAAKAKDKLNYTTIGGREIHIVYAEENRKTPREMRKTGHTSGRYEGRRRTPARSPRRRHNSYSRSPDTKRRDSRSVSRSPSRRIARSPSPRRDSPSDEREYKRRVRSPSPRETSPHDGKRHRPLKKSPSPSIPEKMSPHHEDYRSSRRSSKRTVSPRREISPNDGKDSRSSKRSVSPRKESRLSDDSPGEREHRRAMRSPSPREMSPHVEDYHPSRKSGSGDAPFINGNSSSRRSVSPLDESIRDGDLKSKHNLRTLREISPHTDE